MGGEREEGKLLDAFLYGDVFNVDVMISFNKINNDITVQASRIVTV